MIPGEYILEESPIKANASRKITRVIARNSGDRPVQVGSHYHFFEVNAAIRFDRSAAYGLRLNIPAGTAVRFEPGEEKEVELVPFAGDRVVRGFHNLVDGSLDLPDTKQRAEERLTLWEKGAWKSK